jgi:branched-chain amino acid transport system permease protein
VALLLALPLLALPALGNASTWVTLTFAGLAMGLIIFVIASGLTLVFGLMDVLNFGHGVFIALGAFMATSVMGWTAGPDGPTVPTLAEPTGTQRRAFELLGVPIPLTLN